MELTNKQAFLSGVESGPYEGKHRGFVDTWIRRLRDKLIRGGASFCRGLPSVSVGSLNRMCPPNTKEDTLLTTL